MDDAVEDVLLLAPEVLRPRPVLHLELVDRLRELARLRCALRVDRELERGVVAALECELDLRKGVESVSDAARYGYDSDADANIRGVGPIRTKNEEGKPRMSTYLVEDVLLVPRVIRDTPYEC